MCLNLCKALWFLKTQLVDDSITMTLYIAFTSGKQSIIDIVPKVERGGRGKEKKTSITVDLYLTSFNIINQKGKTKIHQH